MMGGRCALRLPSHFVAWERREVLLSFSGGGGGNGDVRERAGGGQEEPQRGAGREREAVSAVEEGSRWRVRPSGSEAWARVCTVSVRKPQHWPGLRTPLCWCWEAGHLGAALFVWCLYLSRSPLGTGPI